MCWIALVGIGSAGFLLGAGSVLIAYLSTHPPRRRRAPDRAHTPDAFGAPFEEIAFSSHDGLPLSGWYVPAPATAGVLILAHGMSADRTQMLPWAAWLWRGGFSLLLFDFRALGRSGGSLCTMGLHEQEDILGALEYLAGRPDTAGLPIGILGFSMGGVAAILAAARDSRLRAVAAHGAYATLDRAVSERCRRHFGAFGGWVERPTRWLGRRWFPGSADAVSCLGAIGRIAPRPLLLLNGAYDPIVRPGNARDLYAAAGSPCELWILARSGHAYPHPDEQEEYRLRVLDFFVAAFADAALPSSRRTS